jgi:hypothetical protein
MSSGIQLGLDPNATEGAALFYAIGRAVMAMGQLERFRLLTELEAGNYTSVSPATRQIFEQCAKAAAQRYVQRKGLK